jgi:hypothetical protein
MRRACSMFDCVAGALELKKKFMLSIVRMKRETLCSKTCRFCLQNYWYYRKAYWNDSVGSFSSIKTGPSAQINLIFFERTTTTLAEARE